MPIALDKCKPNSTDVKFGVGSAEFQAVSVVDILGITVGAKLDFHLHIDKTCVKSANQLNTLVRLKRVLGNGERKVLLNSFLLSNLSYCRLFWMLAYGKSVHNIEAMLKRPLRFVLNDCLKFLRIFTDEVRKTKYESAKN